MDTNPLTDQKPISDDQELAKALAGVLPGSPMPDQTPVAPVVPAQPQPEPSSLPQPSSPPTPAAEPVDAPAPSTPVPESSSTPAGNNQAATSDLEGIKQNALGDLRPLIDKVDLAPEEKFDTYLLLIRSTDDQALIAPAYAAAQSIADEKRKAEALLDIIKEIDYLSRQNQPSA